MALFISNIDSVTGRGAHLFSDKTSFLLNTKSIYGIRDDINSNSSFFYRLNTLDDREGVVRIESQTKIWKLLAYLDDNITNTFITLSVYKEANANSDLEDRSYNANDIALAHDVTAGSVVYLRQGQRIVRIMVSESISDILYEVSNTTTTTTSTSSSSTTSTSSTSTTSSSTTSTSTTSTSTTSTSTTSTSSTSTSTTTTTLPYDPNVYIEIVAPEGERSLYIGGSGSIWVDWDDGAGPVEVVLPVEDNLLFNSGGTNVKVHNVENVTAVHNEEGADLTAISIPAEATAIQDITIRTSSISSFVTHAEWVNLITLDMAINTSLSSLTTYATWVNLQVLSVGTCISLSSLTTHAEWTSLTSLNIELSGISSLTTHAEWTALTALDLSETSVSSLTTYASWTKLVTLDLANSSISSIVAHAEWTSIQVINAPSLGLSTFIAYREWVALSSLVLGSNAISSASDINDILIEVDASGMSSGSVLLQGGTNAAPTGAGITAKNNLIGRGVTVNTN